MSSTTRGEVAVAVSAVPRARATRHRRIGEQGAAAAIVVVLKLAWV